MDILQEAFLKASTKNCKTIAIPALGTGFLNYPATTVAKCMYDAVINWQSNKPRTQLKSFTFVLYSKNTEVMQVSKRGLKVKSWVTKKPVFVISFLTSSGFSLTQDIESQTPKMFESNFRQFVFLIELLQRFRFESSC